MKFYLALSAPPAVTNFYKSRLRRAIRLTLHHFSDSFFIQRFGKVKTVSISVAVVGNSHMKSLNHQYRNKPTTTDVLSFPGSHLKSSLNSVELGDVVICLPKAREQAIDYGEPLSRELERLAVHGVLHLLGFDHEKNKSEEKKMFSLQDRILRKLSKKHLQT